MAHERLRKFNTKDTYPEQKLDNDLAQAVITRGRTSASFSKKPGATCIIL